MVCGESVMFVANIFPYLVVTCGLHICPPRRCCGNYAFTMNTVCCFFSHDLRPVPVCLVAILTTRLAVLSATECFIGVYRFFTVHTEVVAVLIGSPLVYRFFA